jgi:antitoxin (DNA-binding transcriptional repressor) of toxin-antitoxin stability system
MTFASFRFWGSHSGGFGLATTVENVLWPKIMRAGFFDRAARPSSPIALRRGSCPRSYAYIRFHSGYFCKQTWSTHHCREWLAAIDHGEPVVITCPDHKRALFTPLKAPDADPGERNPAFGLWRDREVEEDVAAYLRTVRAGRNPPRGWRRIDRRDRVPAIETLMPTLFWFFCSCGLNNRSGIFIHDLQQNAGSASRAAKPRRARPAQVGSQRRSRHFGGSRPAVVHRHPRPAGSPFQCLRCDGISTPWLESWGQTSNNRRSDGASTRRIATRRMHNVARRCPHHAAQTGSVAGR